MRKFLGLTAPTPVTVLTGWNRLKHLSTNTKEGSTEKNYYSTVEPVCPRPFTHYHKKLPTSTSRTQYYGTIPISELSQRPNAYQQLHQKSNEALQTYNMRYASFFNLAYPELELDNPLSKMHCICCAPFWNLPHFKMVLHCFGIPKWGTHFEMVLHHFGTPSLVPFQNDAAPFWNIYFFN